MLSIFFPHALFLSFLFVIVALNSLLLGQIKQREKGGEKERERWGEREREKRVRGRKRERERIKAKGENVKEEMARFKKELLWAG